MLRNTPPLKRFLLIALVLVFTLISCNQYSSIPPYFWWPQDDGPKAVSIDAENFDVKVGDDTYDFSSIQFPVHYTDGTSEISTFDISAQVAPYLNGGVAPVKIAKDGAEASFEIFFYDMTIDELITSIPGLMINPSSLEEFCSNKYILLNDYQATAALSIDRYDSMYGKVPVFGNTYFRGEADGAEVGLFANSADFPVAISAYGITVEDTAFTVSERSDDSVRVGAVAIYGQDVTIRNTSLESNLNPSAGINKEERHSYRPREKSRRLP